MNPKPFLASAVILLFIQFVSFGQSTTGPDKNITRATTADFGKNDCEQNVNRLYEMLDEKDQEIKRSREQANELIKALIELKRDSNTQNISPQTSLTTQSNEQSAKLIDHITSKRKTEYHVRRQYIRGPRGGCYYINSNGNKTYVDRSMCD
ncbi:hypothetical protein SAMN05216327_10171 [Dyadobacter sp. SG02]|uniref:hypothetical protein n=1 Tax=Dyadobacter sp. SG02 TaxID=1855291 RepID=UPI0008CCD86D|nr:hypothetical protein [Dyadobacter sp. SG02]SEI38141.1 hypothetical protein SAMN05216327_10171 [Dyadobacter sp. SG02]